MLFDAVKHAANPKLRLRWTPELHSLFLQAVEALGGPEQVRPCCTSGHTVCTVQPFSRSGDCAHPRAVAGCLCAPKI